MNNFKKSPIYPVIFMVILSFILTFLLAALYGFTEPIAKFNEDIELKGKILDVFSVELENTEAETIDKTFNENIEISEFNSKPLYILKENGNDAAYAVPFAGPGLWGEIDGYVGVNSGLNEILGIQFTKQSETPGLGARIEENEYRNQYRDIDISSSDLGNYVINKPAPGGNIDAISGATQTSDSVVNMVNEDLANFIQTKGGN